MAGLISEPETSVEPEEVAELVYVRGDDGSYRGWKTELLVEQITNKVEAKFLLCSYCSGVLRDACSFEKDGKQQLACSLCIPKETNNQTARINRETIDEKQVNCPLKAKGCGWTKELSEVLRHLEKCELFPVACPQGCRDEKGEVNRVERRGVETHKTCCPMRTVKCDYCNRKVKSCKMNPHLELCEEFPISCPNECREAVGLKRKDESNHLNQECPLQETECPYSQYGCEVRVERRYLDLHEKEDIHKHLKITLAKVTKIEKENEELINIDSKFKSLVIPIISNFGAKGKLAWNVSEVKNKISQNVPSFSDPFYVGLYKFQGSIQWNKIENYFGLFLCIMKGEWDDTLKWPLRYKRSVALINQLDSKSNYEISAEVTVEVLEKFSQCFCKPSTERNVSLGCATFITHVDLLQEKYSKDDSIIIT